MKKLKGTQTENNLMTAFAGESQARNRYTYFASQAKKEGFPEVAATMLNIAEAEKGHEKRYLALRRNLVEGIVFKRDQKAFWRCRNCGYIHEGNAAPAECPACSHPQAYFEILGENY
jgi:rubrerythrin